MVSKAVQERLDRARERSVMICTPIARNPVYQYTAALASTILFLQEQNIKVTFQFVVGSGVVCKARNELCAHFLMSDYTDLMFIDDDMDWSPLAIMRLLGSDKPLIGGVGRMRVQKPNDDPSVWCWRPKHDGDGKLVQDEMGNIEALGLGAAFMMVNRRVLVDMIAAHPEWKRNGNADWSDDLREHYYKFFRQDDNDDTRGEVSEDFVFCNRWRELGNTVWIDPTISLGHVGSWNFYGSVSELLVTEEDEAKKAAAE